MKNNKNIITFLITTCFLSFQNSFYGWWPTPTKKDSIPKWYGAAPVSKQQLYWHGPRSKASQNAIQKANELESILAASEEPFSKIRHKYNSLIATIPFDFSSIAATIDAIKMLPKEEQNKIIDMMRADRNILTQTHHNLFRLYQNLHMPHGGRLWNLMQQYESLSTLLDLMLVYYETNSVNTFHKQKYINYKVRPFTKVNREEK